MKLCARPLELSRQRIKNRFLRSATMENMADESGCVTGELLDLYTGLARGGVGLIISGATAVAESGRAWANQMGAWSDGHIEGLASLAETVNQEAEDAVMAVQLHHNGSSGLGYSYGGVEGAALEMLDDGRIREIINAFGQAAGRVGRAGFQAVAVHGAHGYLASEFLSRALNKRTDQWGGSLKNRLRFSREIVLAIKEQTGADFPLLWKINSRDFVPGGSGLEEYAEAAAMLVEAGVDLVEISGGVRDQIKLRARLAKEAGLGTAYFRDALPAFRKALPDTALAVTGGLRNLAAAEKLLAEGADMAGLCRPLICEPGLVNRFIGDDNPEPAGCVDCCNCLLAIAKGPVACRPPARPGA